MQENDLKSACLLALLTFLIITVPWREILIPKSNDRYSQVDAETRIFIEKRCNGDQTEREIVHAKVMLPMNYSPSSIADYSRLLLEDFLNSKSAGHNTQTVSFTFYHTENPEMPLEEARAHRETYFRNASAWVRLLRVTKQEGQALQAALITPHEGDINIRFEPEGTPRSNPSSFVRED